MHCLEIHKCLARFSYAPVQKVLLLQFYIFNVLKLYH